MRVLRVTAAMLAVVAFTGVSAVVPGQAASDVPGVTITKTVTDGKGVSHAISLTVSQNENLTPRQNVSVSWSGAVPSHNYTVLSNPALNNHTEYPMVLMQCWGSDTDSSLDPSHCATGSALNAFTPSVYKDTDKTVRNSTNTYNRGLSAHTLKFQARNGTWYNMYYDSSGQYDSIPSELRAGTALALTARGEWTGANGSRSNVSFEMRGADEYPVLGCSDTQTCTLVAVPILDPQCPPDAAPDCTAGPKTPAGPGELSTESKYLKANDWWLGTNWRNRISVPLSFSPRQTCEVVDGRQPVPISGSELASNVMFYHWDPYFCLDPKRFKLKYITQSEPLARQALTTTEVTGPGANAILTSLPVGKSTRPVVHAPVLDTGFAVSFLIDDADHNQVQQLRLTPLLLAKLITQSYEGGSREPALSGNPEGLFLDPEFTKVNPGLKVANRTAIDANVIMPQPTQTDVIWALTSYINADPEARAWLDGAPDEYSGMVVNPVFRGYTLPQLAAELRDTTPDPYDADAPCTKGGQVPYFSLQKQSVNLLQDAVTALLNRQSPAASDCDTVPDRPTTGTFIKKDPQIIGSTRLIAITSLGQAATYLTPTAQLQVHKLAADNRLWASPTSDGMVAALGYTVQDKDSGVLSLDYQHLAPNAYPGTLPVYAAIPTAGLDKGLAANYAQFLTFAAGDGQKPGTGIGALPPGYAPLPAVLRQYTLQAAKAVAEQKGEVPTPPQNLAEQIRNQAGLTAPFNSGGTGGIGVPKAGSVPDKAAPATAANPDGSKELPTTLATTRGVDSWLAGWGLPILLGVGLIAGVAAPLVRLFAVLRRRRRT